MIVMPHMLLYDQHKSELEQIRDWISMLPIGREDLWVHSATTLPDLLRRLGELNEISLCCADFEAEGEQAVLAVRDRDPAVFVVVIAGTETSPLVYVRPNIMAAGLLLRPLEKAQVTGMLRSVIDMVEMKIRERLFNNEVFVFSTREGTIRVPYSQILYFEARNKKIVLCTSRSEMDFYSTLESITQKVPGYFLRCHKGFIVNKHLVNRIDLSANTLHLIGGFQVPISRSYREATKEALT